MLFVGAIPRATVEQIIACVDLSRFSDVAVCCSGSFRMEQAMRAVRKEVRLHSNDVSLLSCTLGRFAVGELPRVKFIGALEYVEQALEGKSIEHRVAAVVALVRTCHFRGRSLFVQAQRDDFVKNVEFYIEKARERVLKYVDIVRPDTFFPGDFREHVKRIDRNALVMAWPPTHGGDYERFYRPLHANAQWDEPQYPVWDPQKLDGWIHELEGEGRRYVVATNRRLETHPPIARFVRGRGQPIFVYSNAHRASSWRREGTRAQPFSYVPVRPEALRQDSQVTLVPVERQHMNFLKDVYQAAGLVHTDSNVRQYVVLVDGMLIGGFAYAFMSRTASFAHKMISKDSIYLMSDFAINGARKLAKLVAMLAGSRETIKEFERSFFQRVPSLVTTARSKKPVSMKYRGIYELISRDAERGILNYAMEVKDVTAQQIYADWWRRYGKSAT